MKKMQIFNTIQKMKLIKSIPVRLQIVLIVLIFFSTFISFNIYYADSSTSDNLSGYAWTDTIGWISLNCTDLVSCASSAYGVRVDNAGKISGYAWSENIGWISFNDSDVTGCPSIPCTPHLDSTTGKVTGWAKVLSSADSGDPTWDGFISLSGTGYGVTVNACNWSGYAWGSEVVGWVSFSGSGYGVVGSGLACVTPPPAMCTGTTPTNATFCGTVDPLADTPFTSVPSCSFFGVTKCNFVCNSGYIADGNNCRVTQCNDGIDNDGDTYIDSTDAGCVDENDDSENNIITDPTLRPSKRTVTSGDSIILTWNTGGVFENSCVLTANNQVVAPNVFTADDGPTDNLFEGSTTQVINAGTTFEINCGGRIHSVHIEIVPRMFET